MAKIETLYLNYYTLVKVEKIAKYSTTIREEECHGIHTFVDQEELSSEIIGVCIKVNGEDIDITSRLTKEELKLLDKLNENDIEVT